MRSLKDKIIYVLYMIFAKWLPRSSFCPPALWLRRFFCKLMLGKRMGKHANIEHGAEFSSLCSVGNYSDIGRSCLLEGPVTIGNYVMIGPNCSFYTRNHEHSRLDIPMQQQGHTTPKPIVVSDDVWFGCNVIVLPGVKIGCGSIIGAGSVVAKDVPEFAVIGGNPASVIKFRNKKVENND